jgi:hypothetical protein
LIARFMLYGLFWADIVTLTPSAAAARLIIVSVCCCSDFNGWAAGVGAGALTTCCNGALDGAARLVIAGCVSLGTFGL